MKTKISSLLVVLFFFFGVVTAQNIEGTYAIKNVETGKLLRIKDANGKDLTPLVLYSPVNWKCMTWDFQNISGETYHLKNLFTGKTFTTAGQPAKEGVELKQLPISANDEMQKWEFIDQGDKTYLIRLAGTELYVMPSDPKGATNSPVILKKKSGSKLQLWTIYEQHPTM
ncbi:RICIN domain-containing protein [Sunxiuqinia sp. A32]|uniref:RICIN domain-containing protein n=1 Tax=Sunxiuqinia sp. A32 TaxID=3461496 RepID=UPI0040454F75